MKAMKAVKSVKLTSTLEGNTLTLSGYDTYALKDTIKSIGGKWQPDTKSWSVESATPEHIEQLTVAAKALSQTRQAEAKAKQEFERSPEGKAAIKEANRQRMLDALASGTNRWICCEHCEVLDWGKKIISCKPHGSWDGQSLNTMRINGRLYTGT